MHLPLILGAALAAQPVANVPWPANAPHPPAPFANPREVRETENDVLGKSAELTAKGMKLPGLARAFSAASRLPDIQGVREAWNASEFDEAMLRLTKLIVRVGIPPVDAVTFAAQTMSTGMLIAKDKVNQEQMDEVFRSWKAARGGGDDVWGGRQGFLAASTRRELRARYPVLDDQRLDELETLSLRTYCENRLYREQWDEYKNQVRGWLKGQNIRWSGEDEVLDDLLVRINEASDRIREARAESGFFESERRKLIEALLRGGQTGLDRALADYFSRYFGDRRNAQGEKLGPAPARSASRGAGEDTVPPPAAPAATPVATPPGTVRTVFEFRIPDGRQWQVGDWQVKHGSPVYQTGELHLADKVVATFDITNGAEAKRTRRFEIDAAPGTPIKVKVTLPKAGAAYTMAQTVTVGSTPQTWDVLWFIDTLHCQLAK